MRKGGRYIRSSLVSIIPPTTALDLSDKLWLNSPITHGLHHGQMLKVVMCLEERISSKEFDQDTTDAPDVARVAPAEI